MTAHAASHGKESEVIASANETLKAVDKEIRLPEEVKDAGVEKIRGTVELPPDLKKLGVTPGASQMPVSVPSVTVSLPITDDKIIAGLDAPVSSALKWLAVWCVRRLKAAHLVLRKIHGKILRVKVA